MHEEHFILDGVDVKYCFTCRRALPTNLMYFGEHKTKWDGINPNCRECKGGNFRPPDGYKICHKCGKVLEITTNFYWNITRGDYDSPCRECVMAYKRGNKEHINERRRFLRLINPESFREYDKVRRKKYPEKYAAKRKRAGAKESVRIKRRMSGQRREARKRELPATFTDKQWELCREYFNNRCCYCNRELPLEQDHVIPLTKGGEYTINNIIPACRSCNSSKNNRDLLEWYTPKFEFYSELRKKKILNYLHTNGKIQQLAFEF